jgi:hypothetical protein
MQPIRLWTGIGHISYSSFDAKRSWVSGGLPAAGFVFAARCEGCNDVRLIAVPHERNEADSLPLPAHQSTGVEAALPRPSSAPGVTD